MAVIYQVSEITDEIKSLLGGSFRGIEVEGEISNFKPAASGHWYFVLKDERASLSCVMFRRNRPPNMPPPADGDLVRARGDIDVYPPRGTYQLIVRQFDRAGDGRILAILEENKRRFLAEGLFANNRPLPLLPRSVAVITSPTGAAIRDIVRVLSGRDSPLRLRVIPVPVQGDNAAERISAAIRFTNRNQLGDVIVVSRGGGSIEDLLPFSSEEVVRAIHGSSIPVVSAVGHEIDWALSDFAADLRVPTPSAAAEALAPSRDELVRRIHLAISPGLSAFVSRVAVLKKRLERFSTAELGYRFRNFTAPWYQRLDEARASVDDGFRSLVTGYRVRLDLVVERIEGASPFRTLQRGYAIVRDADTREIVQRRLDAQTRNTLLLQFDDGEIPAKPVKENPSEGL